MQKLLMCPNCGRLGEGLLLGWRVDLDFRMIAGSARIFHAGLDWCGDDPEYAEQYGGMPCDLPIEPGVVTHIIHQCRASRQDAVELQRLYNRIAATEAQLAALV